MDIQDASIHPVVVNKGKHKVGRLRLLTLQFGTGFLLEGSHPSLYLYGGKLCHLTHGYSKEKVAAKFSLFNHIIVHLACINFDNDAATEPTRDNSSNDDL